MKINAIILFTFLVGLSVSCIEEDTSSIYNSRTSNHNKASDTNEENRGDNNSRTKQNIKRLAALKPITEARFASWRPKSLLGLPATNVTIHSTENGATFNISYSAKHKKMTIQIIDGAGEEGSQLIRPAYLIETQKLNQKIPVGYVRTMTKNGITAKVRYDESIEEYQLSFLYQRRFYVTMRTINMGEEKTWEAIEMLNLYELLPQEHP